MPIYSLKAHMLRIKQTIGLDFSTALSTSPSPILFCHSAEFFMKFRGPQALYNRPQKTMVRPTCATRDNDGKGCLSIPLRPIRTSTHGLSPSR